MRPILAVVILLVVGAALVLGLMRFRSGQAAIAGPGAARAPDSPGSSTSASAHPAAAAAVDLPDGVAGWSARDRAAHYDPQSIYSYIDGHAEVYLAYGMRGCASRRYAGPGGEADLVADVFELASPEDAFGVFTHDRDGEPVEVGNDALFRFGWLSFWKGRYFVSIVSESETPASKQAAIELGRAIAARVPAEGGPPAIMSALPDEGLDHRTTRFLRHPQILNTHLFLSDDNVLGLGPDTAAVLGAYRRGGARGHLLIVEYPNDERASAAEAAFRRGVLGTATGNRVAAVGDRGFFGVGRSARRVAAAIGTESAALAESLVAEALRPRDGVAPSGHPGGGS